MERSNVEIRYSERDLSSLKCPVKNKLCRKQGKHIYRAFGPKSAISVEYIMVEKCAEKNLFMESVPR